MLEIIVYNHFYNLKPKPNFDPLSSLYDLLELHKLYQSIALELLKNLRNILIGIFQTVSEISTVYLTTIVTRLFDENDIFILLESSIPALQDGYGIFGVRKL